jgi:hypothetical protein
MKCPNRKEKEKGMTKIFIKEKPTNKIEEVSN